jgi:hypothetical protein
LWTALYILQDNFIKIFDLIERMRSIILQDMKQFHNTYHHISFTCNWQLSEDSLVLLGECISLIKAISNTAIIPEYKKRLLQVALIKGAHATTAIEGNTLSIDNNYNAKKVYYAIIDF